MVFVMFMIAMVMMIWESVMNCRPTVYRILRHSSSPLVHVPLPQLILAETSLVTIKHRPFGPHEYVFRQQVEPVELGQHL